MKNNNLHRFSKLSTALLRKAGWFDGRNMSGKIILPNEFQISDVALKVLNEFGNLKVGETGPGIDCAKTIVDFNPTLAMGEAERFGEWSIEINSYLYPLGEVDNGHMYLAIDDRGRVFLLMDILVYLDAEFDRAIDKLLTGVKGKRISRDIDIPT